MLCPFCKEEIADGAIKCKHCASMLNVEPVAEASPQAAQVMELTAAPAQVDIKIAQQAIQSPYELIDSLPMSDQMKAKMRFVHENIKGTKLGLPDYGLKGTAVWSTFNWWAFFFNVIYYFCKGLWQKALTLIAIGAVVNIVCFVLRLPGAGVGTLLIGILAMQSAYYDIYRKHVLKQEFWW